MRVLSPTQVHADTCARIRLYTFTGLLAPLLTPPDPSASKATERGVPRERVRLRAHETCFGLRRERAAGHTLPRDVVGRWEGPWIAEAHALTGREGEAAMRRVRHAEVQSAPGEGEHAASAVRTPVLGSDSGVNSLDPWEVDPAVGGLRSRPKSGAKVARSSALRRVARSSALKMAPAAPFCATRPVLRVLSRSRGTAFVVPGDNRHPSEALRRAGCGGGERALGEHGETAPSASVAAARMRRPLPPQAPPRSPRPAKRALQERARATAAPRRRAPPRWTTARTEAMSGGATAGTASGHSTSASSQQRHRWHQFSSNSEPRAPIYDRKFPSTLAADLGPLPGAPRIDLEE